MAYQNNCPHCSIIPPFVLDKMSTSTDKNVRESALDTIEATARARAIRETQASMLHVGIARTITNAKRNRRIFDCEMSRDLTRKLAMEEGDRQSSDVAVQEAYRYSGITWDFFHKHFGRLSIDDFGMTMVSSVHYSENSRGYENAMWNGSQMIYGDGGKIFGRMTQCLDVVAHELTHGITQHSAGLPYSMQSGALNEHFSDVFGVVVRQWHNKEASPAKANWLVGDKIFLSGESLRSMSKPGTAYNGDPQPDHMNKYQNLPDTRAGDWGGVHINSGIPNRAFYLTAVGLGTPSWEVAAKIWYLTLTERLKGETTFAHCAYETISVARDYFSENVGAIVAKAWIDVGVITSGSGPLSSLPQKVRRIKAAAGN